MPVRRHRLILLAGTATLALLAAGARPAHAQVTLGNARGLDFGRFVAGSGGSVVIGPGGARSATGGVLPLNSSSAGQAVFNLGWIEHSGGDTASTSPITVTITLPPDGAICLTSGASCMAVHTFVSSPATLQSIPHGGTTLSLGATLVVAPNQAPGNYSGSFSLIVNYQ